VQRSLDNFDRQFSQVALQRVIVVAPEGGEALVNYLAANLYLPVTGADLATVIDTSAFPALADPSEQARWLETLGLALRDEHGGVPQVNLYDGSLRITREWLNAGTCAAAVGTALLAMVAGAAVTQWQLRTIEGPAQAIASTLKTEQAALQDLAKRVGALRPNTELLAEAARLQASLDQRQAALQLLDAGGLGHTDGHAAALQAFARQAIDGLWLTGVVLQGDDMALRGRTLDPSLIPAYVHRLTQEAALQGRALRALDIARPPEPPPAGASGPDTTPRLAPYVEFTLAGANGIGWKEERR